MGQIAAAIVVLAGATALTVPPEADSPAPLVGGILAIIGITMYAIETRRAWRRSARSAGEA